MLNKKMGLIAVFASFAVSQIVAGTVISYNSGDVLLCFRKGSDMVVDAGPISTFTNLSPNQRYTVSAFTASQLTEIAGPNSVYWSAFTWFDTNQDSTVSPSVQ